ncbi:phosphopantetheine-binding protein [Paenibacillus curdlanolyticus YK9]|uniref:Phosphopantetheine-binding protein n=1 Tax=Paenibacillus curdlanolyticus YK9 TaxID=717606 RepID=E0I5V2_9BACL|nr:acyl carrier protein [Paenibacillus curdlanolyticus]EFM12344.1 phosphopantetheine-binding protein [Paenibacillus curdlanolyticus YK9]
MAVGVELEDLVQIVTSVLKTEEMPIDELHEDTDLRNYNLSSITAVELIVAVEERYDIIVPEDDLMIENVNTIHKLRQLISKYMTD